MRHAKKAKSTVSGIAKITRPTTTGTHPRARLFRLLDELRRKHRLIWISAPAGAGKTTLAAGYIDARGLSPIWYKADSGDADVAAFFYYMGLAAKEAAPRYRHPLPLLTPDYVTGVSTFASNYFADLFARLKRPGLIVLDNWEELAHDDPAQDVLAIGCSAIPQGLNFVVLSRESPPSAFAQLRASGDLGVIDWEALKLTEQESTSIIKMRHPRSAVAREAIRQLHDETRGWVTGLVLLTEHGNTHLSAAAESPTYERQAVFDYFAQEIFRYASRSIQTVLQKTAFLPAIALSTVEALTGEKESGAILQQFTERNLFTVRHADGGFSYHPLFRSFLIARAHEVYSAEELRKLKQRSASLLARSGDIEAAMSLLQSANDWAEAVNLIVTHASAFHAQGRTQTVKGWIEALPADFRDDPVILYWQGMCDRVVMPDRARPYFERAFALLEHGDDTSLRYLVWMRIVQTYLYEMNDFTPMLVWLNRYPTLGEGHSVPAKGIADAALFTYIAALISVDFGNPHLRKVVELAQRLFDEEKNNERRVAQAAVLISYYLWKGDIVKVDRFYQRLSPQPLEAGAKPLVLLRWYLWKSLFDCMRGAAEDSFRAMNDGLALGDALGVHPADLPNLGFCIRAQLRVGNISAARSLLQRVSALTQHEHIKQAYYAHHASLVALHEGDVAIALHEARRALELSKASGLSIGVVTSLLGLAYVHAHCGDTEAALGALAQARPSLLAMQSKVFDSYYALCEANIHRLRGENVPMLDALKVAFSLAEEGGFVTPAYCPRNTTSILCAIALDADICTDFVRDMIGKTYLHPPRDLSTDKWPWSVRIYALGRFEILKENKPLLPSAGRRKPLQLLQALVAFGGRDVSVNKLVQALWPDTDADMALRTIETTLHRLRRLVGQECILRHENLLTLNPDYCWLDTAVLEQIMEPATHAFPSTLQAERLLKLYQGPFLHNERSSTVLAQRERLRTKFVRTLTQLGEALEAEGSDEMAILCYERGVEVEQLTEDLYRRLMRCYHRLARPSEALKTYHRCKDALISVLHIEPSAETRLLYDTIRAVPE